MHIVNADGLAMLSDPTGEPLTWCKAEVAQAVALFRQTDSKEKLLCVRFTQQDGTFNGVQGLTGAFQDLVQYRVQL